MSLPDAVVLFTLLAGAVGLVALNARLQRLACPDRGDEQIAGCCGMALPAEITGAKEASD